MTDLSKGIIEIDGLLITAETTPEEIKKIVPQKIIDNVYADNRAAQGIFFNDEEILGKMFDSYLFFYRGELKSIELHCSKEKTDKEQFEADCEWLKDILGEPTVTQNNLVIWKLPFGQISVTNFNGRRKNGHQEFVSISYN